MNTDQHQMMDQLKQVECRDSSYIAADPPLIFERARGSSIWDVSGRKYIDMCAGFGVMSLGHNNEVWQSVMRQSAEHDLIVHGMGDVYPSRDKIELLTELSHILPPHLKKGALALSGGQAIEIAVKTAQIASGKQGFISFEGSYHGLDLGILPLTSRSDFKEPFAPWIAERYVKELAFGCSLDTLAEAIDEQNNSHFGCAALIVEPIQGRAGIRLPPPGWLAGIARVCREKGVLLIFDEIFTGLGRCGRMSFADDVPCDLLCLGKALGGGLPLSVCFGRAEVMDAWPQNQGEAIHTGTFFGHPLSCRLALATLKAIHEGPLLGRALELGEKMRQDLRHSCGEHHLVKDIRGTGLMIGIELKRAGDGARWMDLLRSHGVIALANGMQGQGIALTPALTLESDDWAFALNALETTIELL